MNDTASAPPLIFDDGSQEPGLHALIIGVSAYSHLLGGSSQPADELMLAVSKELGQLEGPAQAARDLADFLLARRCKLTRPLRTLRFLASPSPDEASRPDLQNVTPATFGEIARAMKAWQKDAARSNDEVALFYFSGHGTRLTWNDALLLPHDFLSGSKVLDKVFDVTGLRGGMAVSETAPQIAQTQYYFIDACQDDRKNFKKLDASDVAPVVLEVDPKGADDRDTPIFFAARSGRTTRTAAGKNTTRFGGRLLECLKGGGADYINDKWVVTINTLAGALDKWSVYENLSLTPNEDSFNTGGNYGHGDTIVHEIDERPLVPCTFRFGSTNDIKNLAILLKNEIAGDLRIPDLKNPHSAEIAAAYYVISPDPSGLFSKREFPIRPPFKDVTIAGEKFTDVTSARGDSP